MHECRYKEASCTNVSLHLCMKKQKKIQTCKIIIIKTYCSFFSWSFLSSNGFFNTIRALKMQPIADNKTAYV